MVSTYVKVSLTDQHHHSRTNCHGFCNYYYSQLPHSDCWWWWCQLCIVQLLVQFPHGGTLCSCHLNISLFNIFLSLPPRHSLTLAGSLTIVARPTLNNEITLCRLVEEEEEEEELSWRRNSSSRRRNFDILHSLNADQRHEDWGA